jgi:hypothetical protein
MTKMTQDLVRIVSAGGGVQVDASLKLTDDLVRIAAAARQSGARIEIKNSGRKLTQDLVRVASAGGGNVLFLDL